MIVGIITLILLVLFIGGWIWIWNPSHRAELDAAARIPLEDDEMERKP